MLGNLETPSPDNFEFIPNEGFRYKGDGSSIISRILSLTKEGVFLSDKDFQNFSSISQAYLDSVNEITKQKYQTKKIFSKNDFEDFKGKYVYKFISEDTWEKYTREGSFLFSSLGRFREMEHQGSPAGDRFEGCCFSAHRTEKRELISAIVSGFDTLIYATTSEIDDLEYMRKTFGNIVLKIDLMPFAEQVHKIINGNDCRIIPVQYADLKMYRSHLPEEELKNFPPHMTDKMFQALREDTRLPSIFSKPTRFETEKEVRIAIRLEKDAPDMLPIKCKELLKYVTRI